MAFSCSYSIWRIVVLCADFLLTVARNTKCLLAVAIQSDVSQSFMQIFSFIGSGSCVTIRSKS